MPDSASKKLSLVKEIMREGKIEDALQLIKDIEQLSTLTPEEMLRTLYHKADLYFSLRQYKIALKFAEELYEKSQEMKMSLFSLDALGLKGLLVFNLQRFEEYYKILQQHVILFKSIPREDSPEFQEKEVELLYLIGFNEYMRGNFDLALDWCNKSLALEKQGYIHNIGLLTSVSGLLPYLYLSKGEVNLALECAEEAISLIPKGEYYLIGKANTYRVMGAIYQEKGDLNRALEYHKRGLDIYIKIGGSMWMSWSYLNIIQVLLAKKESAQARNYLKEFKQYNEKVEDWLSTNIYPLASAYIEENCRRK